MNVDLTDYALKWEESEEKWRNRGEKWLFNKPSIFQTRVLRNKSVMLDSPERQESHEPPSTLILLTRTFIPRFLSTSRSLRVSVSFMTLYFLPPFVSDWQACWCECSLGLLVLN